MVQNPATSSPGLAFMLATIERFGETGDYTWLDYWRDLRDNDVLVVSGWEEAYYSQFSGGAGEGDRPLVVSYATSPAAEVAGPTSASTSSESGLTNASIELTNASTRLMPGSARWKRGSTRSIAASNRRIGS